MPGSEPHSDPNTASDSASPSYGPESTATLRLLVVGIGGVGGFFGGLLARRYEHDPAVEIRFLARGENLARIRENGLRVIDPGGEFTTRPALATDDGEAAGPADVVLLCTKSYDLESTLEQIRPCLTTRTLVVPTLNGVDARARIEALAPGLPVTNGCVYITSRLTAPGVVENFARNQKLYFGRISGGHSTGETAPGATQAAEFPDPADSAASTASPTDTPDLHARLDQLQGLFRGAGIDAHHAPDIAHVIWRKYLFISSMATATSYFDCPAGELAAPGERHEAWRALYREVRALAAAKGVVFDAQVAAGSEDVEDATVRFLRALPPDTTSSMHSDFLAGKPRAEVDTLSSYVLRESRRAGLSAPTYERMVPELERRIAAAGAV